MSHHQLALGTALALLAASAFAQAPGAPPTPAGTPGRGDEFYVVGITKFNDDTYDVKLKNPRTGYVHSLTVIADIALRLTLGGRVRESRGGGEVELIPLGNGSPPPGPEPEIETPVDQSPEPNPADDQPPEEDLPDDSEPEDLPDLADLPEPARPGADDSGPESLRHSPQNTARPNAPPPQSAPALPKGYYLYAIRAVKVINADPRLAKDVRDAPLATQKGTGRYDVIVNGSFTTTMKGKPGRYAVVSVMRGGRQDQAGLPLTWRRGGLAVLDDGSVVVGRQAGGTPEEIGAVFGEDGPRGRNGVREFMGGGALLIEEGRPVSSDDLNRVQRFTNGGPGLSAEQFRATRHTLVAVRDGQAYLIITPTKAGGRGLQAALQRAGFGSAVMFDGGAGFYWYDSHTRHEESGANVLGLGITVRRP